MKAWIINAPDSLQQEEQPLKRLDGTVKVKLTRTAINRTDVALFQGKDTDRLPLIPCRIAAGLVSEADEGSGFHKGERVLLSPYIGEKVHGVTCNGFLRDYVIVPNEHLVAIPEGISDDEIIYTDYVALATSCMSEIRVNEHDYTVIVGTGAFCLILAQLCVFHRAIPIIVGRNEDELDFARDMGISYCINSERQDVQQRVLEITSGKMADCTVFECVAGINPQFALSLTCQGGKVCIAGFSAYMNKLSVDIRTLLVRELHVAGVSDGKRTFLSALNLLATGAVNVKGLSGGKENFNDAASIMARLRDNPDDSRDVLIVID